MKNINVIYVDGVCNLCNGFVKLVHKNNNNNLFFSTLQKSEYKKYNLKSVVFKENNNIYMGHEAIQRILILMNKPFNFLGYLLKLLPNFFSEFLYNVIANHRYKLFGKKDNCELPTEIEKKYFI
tara:strand:+ start:5926 stop:6297 length:372 start_codon:yes stop_codon:yes gene_type:complete